MIGRLPILGTFALALFQSLEIRAADAARFEWPSGLSVELVADRTNFFLGEPILLHYRIANGGTSTAKISVGGDYRGSTRADRFAVTAFSEDGRQVEDPTPLMQNFGGGLMPGGEIKPGDEWFERLPVQEYCRFDRPGTYTIHAFHDLGFGAARTNDPRNAKRTVVLHAPTEEQARRILKEDEDAKPYGGPTWGRKGESRLDYHCIRCPAFLRPLQERAKAGNESALEGISSIRTLDASRALVELLDHTNKAFAAKAAALIEPRLPHPESAFVGPWGAQRRQFIVTNAWDEALSSDVRRYCVRVLGGADRGDFLTAAKLLSMVGSPAEIPALRNALEVAVAGTNTEYLFEIHYPAPIRAADSLLGAALAIDSNLTVEASDDPSPGDLLLFLARHGGRDRILSETEEAMFARAFRHPLPYLRMKALDCLPRPLSSNLSNLVTERMSDPNDGVQTYAFETARRMQEPRHRELALGVLASARNEWLLRAAHDIALKHGARYEAARGWAGRIVPPKDMNDYFPHEIMRQLFALVAGGQAGGNLETPKDANSALKMKEQWLQFIEMHRKRISAGGLFKSDELPEGLGIHISPSSGVSISPQRS